jgi:hypothetical protein
MNRSERSDVPVVPSQIAQPEGGSIVTLPSAPRLNAEGGGNQAITVLVGASGAFAPDVAMTMTPALELPARQAVCLHGDFGRCDGYHRMVDFIRAPKPRGSPATAALATHSLPPHRNATLETVITEPSWSPCPLVMPTFIGMCEVAHSTPKQFGTRLPSRRSRDRGSRDGISRTDCLCAMWERSRHQTEARRRFSAMERQRLHSLPRYDPD